MERDGLAPLSRASLAYHVVVLYTSGSRASSSSQPSQRVCGPPRMRQLGPSPTSLGVYVRTFVPPRPRALDVVESKENKESKNGMRYSGHGCVARGRTR